jgi:hypothetical protein
MSLRQVGSTPGPPRYSPVYATITSMCSRSPPRKSGVDFRLKFARRSSLTSCSGSLIRAASTDLTPGRSLVPSSCCLTHDRNGSMPMSRCLATPLTESCFASVSSPSTNTSRADRSFNSGEYRHYDGLGFISVFIALTLFQRSRASSDDRPACMSSASSSDPRVFRLRVSSMTQTAPI